MPGLVPGIHVFHHLILRSRPQAGVTKDSLGLVPGVKHRPVRSLVNTN
jgi:hypothetical protein